jgi:hypothetical protein
MHRGRPKTHLTDDRAQALPTSLANPVGGLQAALFLALIHVLRGAVKLSVYGLER